MHFLVSLAATLLSASTVSALVPVYPTPPQDGPFILRTSNGCGNYDGMYVQAYHTDASESAAVFVSKRSEASVAFLNGSSVTFDLAGNEFGLFTHTQAVNLTGIAQSGFFFFFFLSFFCPHN